MPNRSRHPAVVFALAFLPAIGACGDDAADAGDRDLVPVILDSVVGLVEPDELARLKASDDVILIDVRTEEEFSEGHIPGAWNMPIEDFDPASLPITEGRAIILYCRSANRSAKAAQMLSRAQGGKEVRHLAGGIKAWRNAGYQTTRSGE
ncbi:rhodanese-like domain-containing protein [Paraurantiacibacter namhicola]|uniref:Molybdopterin biosynthesis protein MoeB n=1 Tax=Paraurantiacibacter namhicola TaxID=645517 RepID=A0A1C7DBI9_9SPHN|nr:rhodanese-like domain-containing protein [Paraurantiacibacter namhicola]ANU08815.1 molybdopterin biosynthesis protein MoeB [Paraurantiacibacter namhicola]